MSYAFVPGGCGPLIRQERQGSSTERQGPFFSHFSGGPLRVPGTAWEGWGVTHVSPEGLVPIDVRYFRHPCRELWAKLGR